MSDLAQGGKLLWPSEFSESLDVPEFSLDALSEDPTKKHIINNNNMK